MLSKIKIQKIELSLILLVVLQILLLSNMPVAQSYSFHQLDPLMDNAKQLEEKRINNKIKLGINLIIGFLSIKQIGVVSAQDLSLNCCVNMTDGSICQEILVGEEEELCESGLMPTACDSTSECELGCCYDTEEGVCSASTPKLLCESEGGEWTDSKDCDSNLVPQCRLGCCVFGSNAKFMMERKCEIISSLYGFDKDFRDIRNELDCLAVIASQVEGACVFEGGNCRFTTEQECIGSQGQFYKGYLCSHPSLETNCEPQDSISCVEGKDEIYWFDSCGNRENIYDSNKDASWNKGYILGKGSSCSIVEGSISPSTTCGNCARVKGSKCSSSVEAEAAKMTTTKVVDGDFICKNLDCPNAPINGVDSAGNQLTAYQHNGESWCLYDSYIGDGKDTVGSEHWKAYCYEGEVKVDVCGDHREQICQQSTIEERGKKFDTASCVMNMGKSCIGYNEDKDMETKCEKNKHCMIKNVNVDKYFKFSMCVPRYPMGFDLSNEYDTDVNEDACGIANRKCALKEEKEIDKWKVVSGFGDCRKQEFPDKLQNLCISLGDCGNYVNFVGQGTNNEATSGKKANSPRPWTEFISYSVPDKEQIIKPMEIDDLIYLGLINGEDYAQEGLGGTIKTLGIVTGALGVVAYGVGSLTAGTAVGAIQLGTSTSLVTAAGGTGMGGGSVIGAGPSLSSAFSAFGAAAIGFVIGAALSYFLAKSLGLSESATVTYMVMGGMAGAIGGLIYIGAITGPYGWIAVAVIVVAMVVLYAVFGYGKMRDRPVRYQCDPWQPPSFSSEAEAKAQCEKCNEDILRPCTSYRCQSLGKTCRLLNAGMEENPICESVPREVHPPLIDVGTTQEGYAFTDTTPHEGTRIIATQCAVPSSQHCECIPEWTVFNFTLITDEYAQCKYSFVNPTNPGYDEMPANYPSGKSSYKKEHIFTMMMPAVDSPQLEDLIDNVKEQYANMNLYVKCIDDWENYNTEEYIVNLCVNSGPDITPVSHAFTRAIPEHGSTIKFNQSSKEVTFFINEPAECKYSYNASVPYDEMPDENNLTCNIGVNEREMLGWPCKTNLTDLKEDNTIYIKCRDKPWSDVDPATRNTNEEDYVYSFSVSESPLEITSISPEGVTENGFEPLTVEMEVETFGGSNYGSAVCRYGLARGEETILFTDTGTSTHKQIFDNRLGGEYEFYIQCEDSAGNIARGVASFEIRVDDAPPRIVRAFNDGYILKVYTDEPAECYYSLNRCNFDLHNATSMTTGLSEEHSADWMGGVTYHIKCSDLWENTNPDCAMKVIAS